MIKPTGNIEILPGTLKNLFYPPEKDEYTYFARSRTVPFVGGRMEVRGAWAADASMLSYARYGINPMSSEDFKENLERAGLRCEKLIGNWKAPGTQGYFASNEQFAILAFRGTEADDAVDEFDDVDITLVHEPDYRPASGESKPALGHLSVIEQLLSAPCKVHQGFQRALAQVWEEVHQCVTGYRQRHPQAEICFTGHSLGGALAVLAFSRFADPRNSFITFGCPRVGNRGFYERVMGNPRKSILRFVNLNDSVAHIPLESLLYHHAPPECLRFDEDGNLGQEDGTFRGDIAALGTALKGLPSDLRGGLHKIDAPPGVRDHSPARYCIRLWNCV